MFFAHRDKAFLIAEIGVNHNGDVELAKRSIEAAAKTGVDAVKFQTWVPGEITGKFTGKVPYMAARTDAGESRYEVSARLALSYDAFRELKRVCADEGVMFLSTPDGPRSLDFLVDELDMPLIKVGSTELTYGAFLRRIGSKGRPIILSTGLGDLVDVGAAIRHVRATGPSTELVVLQCTSSYPVPDPDVNLRAMQTIRDAFKLPVGFSDHTSDHVASLAAVAMGAVVVEKHFTLDRSLPGPDHAVSADPATFTTLVADIRRLETMLGDGIKRVMPAERENHDGVRRSVVARTDLEKGVALTAEMLEFKRPGWGIAPDDAEKIIGLELRRALAEDEPIQWSDLRLD